MPFFPLFFLCEKSVVFITFPIAINTTLARHIITKELNFLKFKQWFSENGFFAIFFTLLAGADLEALDILYSKLAGLEFFNAPFSDPAKSKIFWGSFLNIFTEDIPQVIIQVGILTKKIRIILENY
jgi:hypothetical protein